MYTTNEPQFQHFHIEGVKHINPFDAYNLLTTHDAVLIDVRTKEEFINQYIPMDSVFNYPMELIADRLNSISKEQNIFLICPGGVRSTKVANLLNINGYNNVANIDGGFQKWIELKLPYKLELQMNTISGGCGCTNNGDSGACC